MSKIIGHQPKQLMFQQRPEYEALYGGAEAGKSDALDRGAGGRCIPHYRGLYYAKHTPVIRAY